jgi:hypothetical protein
MWVAPLAFVLVGGLATRVAAGEEARSAVPAAPSSAVQHVLVDLRTAQSAQEAGAIVMAAKLSEAELRQLDAELAKPNWAATLTRLKGTLGHTGAAKRGPRQHVGESTAHVLQLKNQALASALQHRVQRSRLAVSAGLNAPSGTGVAGGRVRAAARRPAASVPPAISGVMLGNARPPEWPATISRLDPDSPTVGQPFTIVGTGFGSSRGSIVFVVDEALFEAEVTAWTDSRVTSRVPFEALPWDSMADVPDSALARGPRGMGYNRRVWVRLQDGRLGAGTQAYVVPDLELLTPSITGITSGEATPGGTLLVEGVNFGDQPGRDGRVSLMFAAYGLDVLVSRWRDDRITLTIPDSVVGVQAMSNGIVTVTNVLGLTASRSGVSFAPAEQATELPTRTYVAMCHPAGHPLFCWFGDSNEVTPWDIQLRNGWTVDEVWVDVNEIGANSGAYFDRQAAPGDTHAVAELVVWCDGLSRAEATPHMIVKGPRGTNYR